MRIVADRNFRQNQIAQLKFRIFFFFSENRAFYKITWKNKVQPDSSLMTIWRISIACWINKATNTHSHFVILIVLQRQILLHGRASMLR